MLIRRLRVDAFVAGFLATSAIGLSGCASTAQTGSVATTDFIYHNPARPEFSVSSIRDMDAMAARIRSHCKTADGQAECQAAVPR